MEDTNRPNKTLIALVALLVLALISGALWWFLAFSGGGDTNEDVVGSGGFGEPSPVDPTGQSGGVGTLPQIPSSGVPGSASEWMTQFVQLSDFPVSGIGIVQTSGSVRFVERSKGNIYELQGLDKTSVRRITNTTILGVQEAFFGDGGTTVVMRHLDDRLGGAGKTIKTFTGRIFASESEESLGSIEGAYLADDISEVAVAPSGSLIAMVIPTPTGSSVRISDTLERNPREVVNNPLREWIPYLSSSGTVYLASKATYDAPGYLFEVNGTANTYRKVAGGKIGMTALPSPDGKKVLISEVVNGSVLLSLGGITRTEQDMVISESIPLGISSLSQKCVWTKDSLHAYCASFTQLPASARMPDDWYQGVVSTNDSFWRIDAQTGEAELLGEPYSGIGRVFDATSLAISADDSALYFINKQDGILWGMRILNQTRNDADSEEAPAATPEELRDIQGSTP